ncbi:MAG: 50S ribosomal protein L23 [Candidatus Nealsonbacteria bacterium]|nr:50S ribosomal protein L23 [Candidatus Nealsonbacteria bacterium]
MALRDIFKKKEEKKEPEKAEKKSEVLEKKPAIKKAIKVSTAKKTEIQMPKANKKKYIADHDILRSPHITEKATDATEYHKYIFKVGPEANKIEIKKSVESNYGVDVLAVNVINIHRKKRRIGRNIGWAKGYKKAIVTLKKGQKIEIMPR